MYRRFRNATAILATALALCAVQPADQASAISQDKLTLAFIPQENPEKLLDDISVIGGYLSEEMGMEGGRLRNARPRCRG